MRKILALSVVATCVVITGCASPAQVSNMKATTFHEQRTEPNALQANLYVSEITGGKGTNPLWTSQVSNSDFRQALEASLASAGMLASGSEGQYLLRAHLDGLRQPLFGASMTVSSKIHYVILDRQTNKTVFERTIDLPYTAAFSDAFAGVTRLRLANEGAIRVNIQALIKDLIELDIAQVAL